MIIRKPDPGFGPRLTQTRLYKQRWLESENFGLRKFYLCSKNKGADQLQGYHTADQCIYFRIKQKAGFLMTWLKHTLINDYEKACLQRLQ